jgi:O-acetylhomoserine/O-acetylserine sulfhydrylase-like pyridoxal-dependent enzyme
MEESNKIYDKIAVFDRVGNFSDRRHIISRAKYTYHKQLYQQDSIVYTITRGIHLNHLYSHRIDNYGIELLSKNG